jgi:hypothetical protein
MVAGGRTSARTGRGRRGDLTLIDLRDQLVDNTSRSLVGVAWRWRNEVAGVLLVLLGFGWVVDRFGRTQVWVCLAVAVAFVVGVPQLRRFVAGRFWCTVTRHRLFAVFAEARIFNRSGRYPLIVRIGRTPVGERALVWCRPGICVEDLDLRIPEIRTACFARDARVFRSERFSQLVTVEVVRRDPLAAKEQIPSPLVRETPAARPSNVRDLQGVSGDG